MGEECLQGFGGIFCRCRGFGILFFFHLAWAFLFAEYLGRSVILMRVPVMFSGSLPLRLSWSFLAPNLWLLPNIHGLTKEFAPIGPARSERGWLWKEGALWKKLQNRGKWQGRGGWNRKRQPSIQMKEGKDWNPTARRRVILFYKGKRRSRDNVRTTVMCHHSQPVISTLALGRGGWLTTSPLTGGHGHIQQLAEQLHVDPFYLQR